MTSVLRENIPLALPFIAAIVGIPLWMTAKRPDLAPDHSAARAYLAAKHDAPQQEHQQRVMARAA
jgi:hypothetical protein